MQPERKLRYPMTRARSLFSALAGGVAAVLAAALLGVSAPAASAESAVLARDSFSRTSSAGLGKAEAGGAWSASSGVTPNGSEARGTLSPGIERVAMLNQVLSTDTDLQVTILLPRPDSGSVTVSVIGRHRYAEDYSAALVVHATGSPVIQLLRNDVPLATESLPALAVASGDRVRFRMQAIGTSPTQLRAKVWRAGSSEPAGWPVTASDSAHMLQAPGGLGITALLSRPATPSALTFAFDDLIATSTSSPPPAPNLGPKATFTLVQDERTITVDASGSSDPDGTIRSYAWTFADGTKATGKTATHTYAGEGSWTVVLTVTDDDGAIARSQQYVRYITSAVFDKTIVSYNSAMRGPGSEQFFGSGADVVYDRAPTLTGGIWLSVSKPGHATPLRIHVQPPNNGRLTVGHFRRITEFSTYTTPGLSVSYGSSGLSFLGDLEIRELTADSTGKLTSFDIVFGGTEVQWSIPIWGQIRADQPDASRYVLAARALSFPSAPVGAKPIFATQWIRNTSSSALPVGRAAVTGGSTSDYVLADDRCSGRTLAAGARCSLRVGYAPRAAGTRNTTLSIPIDGAAQRIELSGWAPAGTSKITLSSEDLGQPSGTTYANGTHRVWSSRVSTSTSFDAVPQEGRNYARVHIRHGQDDRLRLGRYAISTDPMDRNGHWMHISVPGLGCQPWKGSSYTVHSLRQTADGVPTMVDLSFTAYCLGGNGKATTGRVQYNLRSDLTAPSRPTSLTVSGSGSSRSASWKRSTSGDQSYTVARLVPGTATNGNGTSGYAVYAGTGSWARLPAMKKGQRYTLHVFSVDKTGNVSAPATLAITG